MAATGTPTPNIGLRIPLGTDPASVDDINYNSNLIDTKLGAVGNDSVQDQIDALNGKIQTSWFDTSTDSSGNIQLKHNGNNIPSTAFVASVYIEGSMIGIPFVKQSDSTWICKVLNSSMSIVSSGTSTRVHLVVVYP